MMRTPQDPRVDRSMIYQIRVQGMLDESWSDWLEGLAITFEVGRDGSEITVITGHVIDQAALHGILNRIRDLNVPLLSVQLLTPEAQSGVSSSKIES